MNKGTVHRGAAFVVTVLFAVSFFLLPAAVSRAAGDGIEMGAFKVYPALEVKETYDSNIFLTTDNEEDDFITSITPSLKVLLPMEDFFFQFEGDAGIVRYVDNNDDDNEVFRIAASLGADFPGGLGFVLADTFTRNYLPTLSEFDLAEYYDINQLYGKVDYEISGDFKIDLEYFRYNFVYDESDDLDRVENTYAATLFYKFLPKTSALIEVGFSDLAYDEDPFRFKDNQATQARAGLTWDMTGKSTGEVRVGYQWKNYGSDEVDDQKYVVAAGSVNTAFSQYTFLDVELRRATVESDYTNNPHYISTNLSVDLKRKFTHKITGTAGAFIRNDSYPEETTELDNADKTVTDQRSDSLIGARLGLEFQMFRWFSVKADYGLENRDSNLDRFDYDDNRFTLSAKAAF